MACDRQYGHCTYTLYARDLREPPDRTADLEMRDIRKDAGGSSCSTHEIVPGNFCRKRIVGGAEATLRIACYGSPDLRYGQGVQRVHHWPTIVRKELVTTFVGFAIEDWLRPFCSICENVGQV